MTEAVYKGLSALVLENDILCLTFLPGYGFKLASLLSKKTGREWLFQSPENTLRIPEYGAPFSAYDSSGFDEVFPSIDACPYPDGPYKGLPVPDHGELWTLPWEGIASPDGKSVKAFTESKIFPYIFSRRTTLNNNEITFEYEVENTSCEEFKFIWTPHCLLACSPATRIIVPENLTQVMTVEHSTQHLGVWGSRHSYPITTDIHGKTIDLAATEPASACNCEKFFLPPLTWPAGAPLNTPTPAKNSATITTAKKYLIWAYGKPKEATAETIISPWNPARASLTICTSPTNFAVLP